MGKQNFIWKSADTGRIVTAEFAKENPKTTYQHHTDWLMEDTDKEIKDKIVLNPKDYAVRLIPDYFAQKAETKRFDATIQENNKFNVGVIDAAGEELPQAHVGKIIYFQKDIADVVDIKGIKGPHHMVNDTFKILIRLDQTEDNY